MPKKYTPNEKASLHIDDNYSLNNMYLEGKSSPVKGISYCGVDRAKSMGLYSYILDIFSH